MKTTIKTDKAPASTSPVAQGTKGGGLVFIGGQMPRDMKSGQIVDGALINPIGSKTTVSRIGQPTVVPGTKPTLGWACVPEAKQGDFCKVCLK